LQFCAAHHGVRLGCVAWPDAFRCEEQVRRLPEREGSPGHRQIEVSPTIAKDDRPPHAVLAVLSGRLVSRGTAMAGLPWRGSQLSGGLAFSNICSTIDGMADDLFQGACVTGIGALPYLAATAGAVSSRPVTTAPMRTSGGRRPRTRAAAERCRRCSSLGGMRNRSGPSHGLTARRHGANSCAGRRS
jgi:hypothetical protein